MRTLPKSQFLVCFAVAALSGAGVFAFADMPAFSQTAHRHHHGAKPAAPDSSTDDATTPPAAAAPATAKPDANDPEDDPNENRVAAIINNDIVSEYDVRQRLALVIATSGMPRNAETIKKLRPQILEQLKTEKLQLEEAQRKSITVTPTEVDKEIDGIVKDNHLDLAQLKGILAKSGVAFETLRAQIAVQLAWQKAIEDEYGDRVNVTDADVTDEMARIMVGKDKPHFLVSEIFLTVDNSDQEEKVHKSADDLYAQLQNGAPFPSIARQFSQNPTAANGGDIGWVHEGQLPTELNDALKTLPIGGVSKPVRATGGYYLLALRQRQEPAGTKLPDPATQQPKPDKVGYLPLARILLPIPPKAPQNYIDAVGKGAVQIRDHIESCAQIEKAITTMKGVVFMNLGEMRLADLSQQIQDELAKTKSGEATPPLRSAAGIEIIVRCDKRAMPLPGVWEPPTRQVVERQLFQQQISMLARRYIRDLRRQATIQAPTDVVETR